MRIDLRRGFSQRRSQGNLGSCSAMAATSILEYVRNRTNGWYKIRKQKFYSPRFVYFNNRLAAFYAHTHLEQECMVHTTHPKDMDNGSNSLLTRSTLIRFGACDEQDWDYPGCGRYDEFAQYPDHFKNKFALRPAADCYNKALRALDFLEKDGHGNARIDTIDTNPDTWIHELDLENPIYIAIEVPQSFRTPPDKDLYDQTDAPDTDSGHAIVIAGYDSRYPVPGKPGEFTEAFLLRNSWGDNWGDEGHLWVSRRAMEHIVIKSTFSQPLVFRPGGHYHPLPEYNDPDHRPPQPVPGTGPRRGPHTPSRHGDFIYCWWLFDEEAQFYRAKADLLSPRRLQSLGHGRILHGPAQAGAKNQPNSRKGHHDFEHIDRNIFSKPGWIGLGACRIVEVPHGMAHDAADGHWNWDGKEIETGKRTAAKPTPKPAPPPHESGKLPEPDIIPAPPKPKKGDGPYEHLPEGDILPAKVEPTERTRPKKKASAEKKTAKRAEQPRPAEETTAPGPAPVSTPSEPETTAPTQHLKKTIVIPKKNARLPHPPHSGALSTPEFKTGTLMRLPDTSLGGAKSEASSEEIDFALVKDEGEMTLGWVCYIIKESDNSLVNPTEFNLRVVLSIKKKAYSYKDKGGRAAYKYNFFKAAKSPSGLDSSYKITFDPYIDIPSNAEPGNYRLVLEIANWPRGWGIRHIKNPELGSLVVLDQNFIRFKISR